MIRTSKARQLAESPLAESAHMAESPPNTVGCGGPLAATDPVERPGADPAEQLFGRRLRGLVIGLLTVVAAAAFSRLGVSTALPAIAADLDGMALYGWVFTAFTLASLVGLAIAGPLTDRYGTYRPFLVGTVLFSGGLLISSVAPAMWVVVLGRTLEGFAAGMIAVATYATIGTGLPERLRPRMLALNASAFTIPALIGPVLAGFVAEHLTWRWVFAVIVPLAPLAAIIVRNTLVGLSHASRPCDVMAREARSSTALATGPAGQSLVSKLVGGAALSVGLGAILLAPTLAGVGAWFGLAVGVPLAIVGIRSTLPSGTLRLRRGLPSNVVFGAALTIAFFTADLYIPLALTTERGISAALAGGVLASGIIGWTVAAHLPERLLRSGWSAARIAALGVVLLIVGLGMFAVVTFTDLPIVCAAAAWIVAGAGAGIAFTTNSITILSSHEGEAGGRSSQMELGNYAGMAIGTGAAGALIALVDASPAGLAGIFAVSIAGAIAALGLTSRFARP